MKNLKTIFNQTYGNTITDVLSLPPVGTAVALPRKSCNKTLLTKVLKAFNLLRGFYVTHLVTSNSLVLKSKDKPWPFMGKFLCHNSSLVFFNGLDPEFLWMCLSVCSLQLLFQHHSIFSFLSISPFLWKVMNHRTLPFKRTSPFLDAPTHACTHTHAPFLSLLCVSMGVIR